MGSVPRLRHGPSALGVPSMAHNVPFGHVLCELLERDKTARGKTNASTTRMESDRSGPVAGLSNADAPDRNTTRHNTKSSIQGVKKPCLDSGIPVATSGKSKKGIHRHRNKRPTYTNRVEETTNNMKMRMIPIGNTQTHDKIVILLNIMDHRHNINKKHDHKSILPPCQ